MSPLNRFNWLAGSYDHLVSIVFGKALHRAQLVFLRYIPTGSHVLILGGGTGKLLSELIRLHPSCHIWYIEASSAMIKQAKRKIASTNAQIHFIHGTENSIPPVKFDVVITNFFLDLFTAANLNRVIQTIKASIKPGGMWLVCEFRNDNKLWQKILLNLMYRFFKITCGIDAAQLPPWESQLRAARIVEQEAELFFHGFIKSAFYKQ